MTFPTNITSATPPKYKFRLVSGGRDVFCDPEPLDWASGELIIDRDLDVGGVFSSYQSESLTFVGNGGELLRELFTNYELGAECTLFVYWWDSSVREYKEFPNSFNIDFNFYETVFVGKFGFGVKVKAVNSSIKSKLENRKDKDVDLNKLVSIGEVNLTDFVNLKKKLYYSATNVAVFGKWYKAGNFDLPRYPGAVSYIQVPLDIISSDYTEMQSVPYRTKVLSTYSIKPFFKAALRDYTFSFYYSVKVNVSDKDSTTPWTIKVIETAPNGTLVSSTTLLTFGDEKETIIETQTIELEVHAGNDLKMVIAVQNVADIKARLWYTDLSITQQIAQTDDKTTEGIPIYEALLRCTQLIIDEQYPLRSDKFGRSGIQYDEAGSKYTSSDQTTYAHIQTGLNQRGLLNSDVNNPFTVNFEDLFNTCKCSWNVGYGFEKISGKLRMRIEDYSYFFKNELILDLSSRINKYDIVSSVMTELVPSEIKSGFDNFEYKEVNGIGEPNTTSLWTTKINTSTKYEIISPYRADTMGILQNLSTPFDTTDTKQDSDIFIVKTDVFYDGWKPEKDKNIAINENSLFGEDLLNRYFLPSRNLKRHGNRIKTGLRLFPSSYLQFQKSDKQQNLKTTGEGYTISENEDILIGSLDAPIYKPISHTVEISPFDWSDLETIQANPYGYIKLSDTISGFLLNLKKKNNEAKAILTIIEKA